ncbi:transferase activity protein [[Candida] boidinii]|nr:transferase activity protein [[Candida] boidinii]
MAPDASILKGSNFPTSLPLTSKTQSPRSYLLTSILNNHLGEQTAYLFSVLLSNGRLNLIQLQQRSKLKPTVIKRCLVSLIQLNCVVYFKEDNYGKPSTIYYYANEEGAFKLLYANEIVLTIKKFYKGEIFASIIQNVLSSGNLTINDYLSSLSSSASNSKKLSKTEKLEIEKCFSYLTKDKWLIPIDESFFQSSYDNFNKIYKIQNNKINKEFQGKVISQTKKLNIVNEATKDLYLKKYIINHELNLKLYKSANNNFDDDADDDDDDDESDISMNGNTNNGDLDASGMFQKVSNDIPLTVNFDRFLKKQRSVHLESEVRHRVGNISAKIYRLLLNKIEVKSRSVRNIEIELERYLSNVGASTVGFDPTTQDSIKASMELKDQEKGLNITSVDIYKELVKNGYLFNINENDLLNTIFDSSNSDSIERKRKLNNKNNSNSNKKVKLEVLDSIDKIKKEDDDGNENGMDANDDGDGDDDDFDYTNGTNGSKDEANSKIIDIIDEHLKLLCDDTKLSFLKSSGGSSYYVPFTKLMSEFTSHSYKQHIKHIFGQDILRILNCVEDNKLIDEKTISRLALMKEPHIRSCLARMTSFELIEIQEIPKTQDRSAMRAVFAFRHKYSKSVKLICESLFFNMGECLERIELLKSHNKILLDKISREDVKGREHELLLTSELKQLQTIFENEKLGLAKFNRLKSSAEIFYFFEE